MRIYSRQQRRVTRRYLRVIAWFINHHIPEEYAL